MLKYFLSAALLLTMVLPAAEPVIDKLANLNEILRYPAPCGVAPSPVTGTASPAQLREFELLLDLTGAVADAFSRYEYLEKRAEFLCPGAFTEPLQRLKSDLVQIRDGIVRGHTADPDAKLVICRTARMALEQALNARCGGETAPTGSLNLYGWVKSFGYVLRKKLPEYEEPAPWRMLGLSYIKLAFKFPGEKAVFHSGPVSSVYEYDDMTFRFSALTPAWVIDSAVTELNAKILANPPAVKRLSPRQVLLENRTSGASPQVSGIAVVADAELEKAEVTEDRLLRLKLRRPGRVALVQYHPKDDPCKVADFYLQHLARLPEEIVQIQNGNQVVEYALDSRGRIAAFHPVSPLLTASENSPYPVKLMETSTLSPDGFRIVPAAKKGIRYSLPLRMARRNCGINIACRADNTPELYRSLREAGADSVRLVCGYGCEWDETGKAREIMQKNLKLAVEAGLKVGLDNHHWEPDRKKFGKWNEPKYQVEFIRRWKLMLQWAAPWRDALLWYDLMNEPLLFSPKDNVTEYYDLIRAAVRELRKLDGKTPFLVEVANMGNPIGAFDWEDPGDSNVILGYHDYWPHIFTHQSVVESKNGVTNLVPYPAFLPMISWEKPSWRNNSEFFLYYDRWKGRGMVFPVLELAARTGLPVDCGELGVVGYGAPMTRSGTCYMADALERLRGWGFSSMVWGVHGGYTWQVPAWRSQTGKFWLSASGKERK